jgi:hypothetical protein
MNRLLKSDLSCSEKYQVNKSFILLTFITLFSTFYIVGQREGNWQEKIFRRPAGVSDDSCYNLSNFFLINSKEGSMFKHWSKLSSFQKIEFDNEKFINFRNDYLQLLQTERPGSFEVGNSPEAIMGYIDSIRMKTDAHPRAVKNSNIYSRFQMKRLLNQLNEGSVLNSVEEITQKIYNLLYGQRVPANRVLSEGKSKEYYIRRVVEESIASNGVNRTFKAHQLSQFREGRLKKFSNSRMGKILKTGLFNIGVLVGLPPIYVPKFSPFKLSDELAMEVLEKGLTDSAFKKIEIEFNLKYGELSPLLSLREEGVYEFIRRYYLAGVSVYLTFLTINEFILLEDEEDAIDEMTANLNERVDSLEESVHFVNNNIYCQGIIQCLKDLGVENHLVHIMQKSTTAYQTCVSVIDPDNRCKN